MNSENLSDMDRRPNPLEDDRYFHPLEDPRYVFRRPRFLDSLNTHVTPANALAHAMFESDYCPVLWVEGLGWHAWNGSLWRRKTVEAEKYINDFRLIMMGIAENYWRERLTFASGGPERVEILKEQAAWNPAKSRAGHAEIIERVKQLTLTNAEDLDKMPLWINTPDGVICLKRAAERDDSRFFAVRSHEHLVSKMTAVSPHGDCPTWLAFLNRIFAGDQELIRYLQRAVGYSLTGLVREHCFFLLHGTGANGKSSFLETIRHVMGDYAYLAPAQTFTENGISNRHPTEVAALRGARLVVSSETEAGSVWAESRIKSLTGGDTITARFMRQDFFSFDPTFKLWIATNHLPSLRNVGPAMARRIHMIPFRVTIPPQERDKALLSKLREEAPGIFSWAIDGALDYLRNGLNPPETVLAASREYLQSADTVQAWLDDCTIRGDGFVAFALLYDSYKKHAAALGEPFVGSKEFSQQLKQRGFANAKSGSVRGFRGLSLQQASALGDPDDSCPF